MANAVNKKGDCSLRGYSLFHLLRTLLNEGLSTQMADLFYVAEF